jgi:hypothetical protein
MVANHVALFAEKEVILGFLEVISKVSCKVFQARIFELVEE